MFVKPRSLAASPHYHPCGIYIGWVEMWEVDGAIELTMVEDLRVESRKNLGFT